MDFKQALKQRFAEFFSLVATEKGDWTVKGFIDVYKNIYTTSVDTKVVSKIIELMIFPVILDFARANDFQIVLATHQNHYPDVTFIRRKGNEKIALDLKSTYRLSSNKVNGMTLGAFTGYFRNRTSRKNISFPYAEYDKHYILGVVYSRADLFKATIELEKVGYRVTAEVRKALGLYVAQQSPDALDALASLLGSSEDDDKRDELKELVQDCLIDEKKRYKLDQLPDIMSVVCEFDFFVQEKWKIASDRPGSGNTKNIGSTTILDELKNGTGIFTKQPNGEAVFNDYWMFYLTKDMARAIDSTPPYKNLKTYLAYKESAR
jgi:hypothetical protein